jgi:hypothetical protein
MGVGTVGSRSPTTGSQRGQGRSIFVRVKLLENVAMVLGMKSHTTRLIDEEKGLAVTAAEKKAVAKARRFARACGLEHELWVSRGEACGTLALGHVLDVLDEQGTPMRVVTSISVGNAKTPPKIFYHRVDKFSRETAKEFGRRPIERNGKPITLAEATQGWDAGARDKIQGAVDAYEEMQKERRKTQLGP